jgi:DNA-binding MarR family transcriptional regulator
MAAELDEHVQIGRQLGIFLRRAERFWNGFRLEPDGPTLERGAYLLLGQIAADGPRRLSAVAETACLDLSTVSRQVAALEAAGLVSRTTDATDRRAHLIEVTPTGRAVLARNREKWQVVLRDLMADWTPEERAQFVRLFVRFNDALAARDQERKR